MKLKTETQILIFLLLFFSCSRDKNMELQMKSILQEGVSKLRYNNPDLLVDLDVGFKSVPMPMDFDGDGDLDLIISESGAYVEAGLFYFENLSGNEEMPVFRHGEKVSTERFPLGLNWDCFESSTVDGASHILIADRNNSRILLYKNFPENLYFDKEELPVDLTDSNIPGHRVSRWKMLDFNGDSKVDLVGFLETRRTGCQILVLKNKNTNDEPLYSPPEILKTLNGNLLGTGVSINPLLADFDNDGDLDFIDVAPYADFIYFENTGTSGQYNYQDGKPMYQNNELLRMESRYGRAIKASAIDWNKDGFIDIIAGDEDGKVSFLKNTGKIVNGIPEFKQPHFLQQKARFVDTGALATPRIFDWDGDGLDDIVSGNGAGNIYFIKNLGGNLPSWDAPRLLEIDGEPVRIIPTEALPNTEEPFWGYTTIDVGDWDHDGLPDILVNDHNGNIVWLKNTGKRSNPKLTNPQPLEVEWEGEPLKPAWTPGISKGKELLTPWRTSPFIKDFDKDGLNDLVMLDYQGYLSTYFRSRGKNGQLILLPPSRNFIHPDGSFVRLNQKEGKSSGRVKIAFADWDGDGLEDLLFTAKPSIDWMKNMGMKDGKMMLQYMRRVVSQTLMGHTGGPTLCDFNRDCVFDLIVGTETGVLYYWERPSADITTTMTTVGKHNSPKDIK